MSRPRSADKIYEVMCNFNVSALKERYGNASEAFEPFEAQPMDTKESTRRTWLANLYTVARCYRYQISEGMVVESEFYKAFGEWVNYMAYLLAEYIVEEVRPAYRKGQTYKPWDQF